MNFNMHQSLDKTEYFLDFFIIQQSLNLVDNILNPLNHQYYLYFLANNFSKYENS